MSIKHPWCDYRASNLPISTSDSRIDRVVHQRKLYWKFLWNVMPGGYGYGDRWHGNSRPSRGDGMYGEWVGRRHSWLQALNLYCNAKVSVNRRWNTFWTYRFTRFLPTALKMAKLDAVMKITSSRSVSFDVGLDFVWMEKRRPLVWEEKSPQTHPGPMPLQIAPEVIRPNFNGLYGQMIHWMNHLNENSFTFYFSFGFIWITTNLSAR